MELWTKVPVVSLIKTSSIHNLTTQFSKDQNYHWPRVALWINLIRTAVFGSRQRIPNVPQQGFRPLDPECPRSFPTSVGPLPLPVGGRVTEEVISVDNAVSHTHPRPLTTPCHPLQDPRHRGFERGEGVLDTSCLTSRIDRV